MSKKGGKVQQNTVTQTPLVNTKPIPEQQHLPKQLEDLLRAGLKHYQSRHYDKGMANCKKILASFPCNGEAYSLLAASEYAKDSSKVDAKDILARLKQGVTYNLRSTTCWHLYGIVLRLEKQYEEACKTFTMLTRLDRTNFGLYRELYYLQIHIGDYKGAMDTRVLLTSTQGRDKTNLFGQAIAADLKGDIPKAISVIEDIKKTQKLEEGTANGLNDVIHYLCSLYKQQGEYQKALDLLVENEFKLVDKVCVLERMADLNLLLKNNEKAMEMYKKLLSINSDNVDYYVGIAKALEKPVNKLEEKLDEFVTLCKEYAKKDEDTASVMIMRALPVNETYNTMFKKCLIRLIQKHIITVNKLLVSLFNEETSFESKKKYEVYVSTLGELKKELTEKEDLEFIMLTETERLLIKGDIEGARREFDSFTIEVETIENLMVKARLTKKEGKLPEAAEIMDAARKLDLADRYLANRTCKYYMRYGNHIKGLEMFKLFDRSPDKNDSPTKFDERLDDLEVIWFLMEYANGLFIAGEYDQAENYANRVIKAFKTYIDDFFDFHGFILDRYSYDTYLSCLRCSKNYSNSPYKDRALKLLDQIKEKKQSSSN